MTQLIPNDISRCPNHRCLLRTQCKRYMQIAEDWKTFGKGSPEARPYNRHEPEGNQLDNAHCSHQLPYHHAYKNT